MACSLRDDWACLSKISAAAPKELEKSCKARSADRRGIADWSRRLWQDACRNEVGVRFAFCLLPDFKLWCRNPQHRKESGGEFLWNIDVWTWAAKSARVS